MKNYKFYREKSTQQIYVFLLDPKGQVKKEMGAGKYTQGVLRVTGMSAYKRSNTSPSTGNISTSSISLPLANFLKEYEEVSEKIVKEKDPLLIELVHNYEIFRL